MRRALALGVALGIMLGRPARAQTLSVSAARWFSSPHVSDYRVTLSRWWLGPVALSPFAELAVQGPSGDGALLGGVGAEAIVRILPSARPYLIGSLSGGIFDFKKSLGLSAWGAWSVGAGAELVRIGPAALSVELRYHRLSRLETDGVSLGLRLGTPLGRRQHGVERRSAPEPRDEPSPSGADRVKPEPTEPAPTVPLATAARDPSAAATVVVDRALAAMGTPYRWGGSDANGFDCSGLIQFAYAEAGVRLPRRSVEQARAGQEIERTIGQLLPGDILLFGPAPGESAVSHVGLYLGNGRFIHSASSGVVVSQLAADDPTGRWWFDRWIGARRIL